MQRTAVAPIVHFTLIGPPTPPAPALERHIMRADERVLAESRWRRTPDGAEKDEARVADAFRFGRRDRPGAAQQLNRRCVGRMDRDAADHIPAKRCP
jgi:hypothetical protein